MREDALLLVCLTVSGLFGISMTCRGCFPFSPLLTGLLQHSVTCLSLLLLGYQYLGTSACHRLTLSDIGRLPGGAAVQCRIK